MKKAIIIPVYLRLHQPEELLSLEGFILTMRAIKSLRVLKDQDFTLILPVCFDLPEKEKDSLFGLERIFRDEVRPFRFERTLIFSSLRLQGLREYLAPKNFKKFYPLIDLKGFSKIRNTGLLLAQALSMDMVIFMDNDEMVEDPHYLRTASEYLNQRWNGKLVSGKGGFYLNPDGSILLTSRDLWWDFLWDKTSWMNRTYEKILQSKDRLVCSPLLLGGNLVLHHHLFQTIPFDPYIPRGEDTDYFINAIRAGFYVLFDRDLRVKHLHPERTGTYFYQELKGDIERFLYERQKVKMELGLNLDPYPGYFLKWTLYPRALFTSIFLSLDYLLKREWRKAEEVLLNLRIIFQKRSKGWLNYLKFREDWETVMKHIRAEGMEELLKDCWI